MITGFFFLQFVFLFYVVCILFDLFIFSISVQMCVIFWFLISFSFVTFYGWLLVVEKLNQFLL
jgi:hypothetical protein